MKIRMLCSALLAAGVTVMALLAAESQATSLEFAGSQYNLGGTFFPGGTPPCCIVPWRSDSAQNTFAVSDQAPDRYYGTAGYAMFATTFLYPNANVGYSGSVNDPVFTNNDVYVDKIDLPNFVTGSQILSSSKAGGWSYALVDDPVRQHGERWWTFDGVNYPPPDGTNTTGGIPYVKVGLLNGGDIYGNDPATTPTARWGFEVGANAPKTFRVGVMTDGLDAEFWATSEVFLTHAVNDVPVETISSGQVIRNRFIDLHFFDITDAQPGDQFVFSGIKGASDPSFASPGISGFTFDVLVPEPTGLALFALALAICSGAARINRRK